MKELKPDPVLVLRRSAKIPLRTQARNLPLRKFFVFLAVAVLFCAGLILIWPTTSHEQASLTSSGEPANQPIGNFRRPPPPALISSRAVSPENAAASLLRETSPKPSVEPVENATIGYLINDFRLPQKALADYKFKNLKLTDEGITLADASGAPRTGTLESPALPLLHPSNMVGPIWRQQLPEGTSIEVEISLSPDNQNWSAWFKSEPNDHDEILPAYPDGRPNPHYGAIAGEAIANGLKLSAYVKYRVTLSSENKTAPVFQEVKIFHVDSTQGQGYVSHID